MSLANLISLLLQLSIMLSVFAIALKATFSDATYLFRRPGQLVRALVSMNVVMPLFALAVGATFNLNAPLKIALVALSVSPIPPILPNKALKAGGKEDYTIGLLAATAVLAIIFIPLTMELFKLITAVPLQMTAGAVAMLVLTSMLAPLFAGILFRAIFPRVAERAAKPAGLVATIILIVSFLPILFTSIRAILTLVGDGTLFVLGSFALIGLLAGHLLGGPEPENRPVLALATASRHPAVAMAIAHANFPDQKLAGALVLVYLVVSGLLSAPYLNWIKRVRSVPPTPEKHVEV